MECFEDYYAEIHDVTFRLRRKPEQELIKIIKSNVKPSLATVIYATKVENIAEIKLKGRRSCSGKTESGRGTSMNLTRKVIAFIPLEMVEAFESG